MDTEVAQLILRSAGFDPGPADGVRGPKTMAAARRAVGHSLWTAERTLVAAAQAALRLMGHDPGPVDGLPGPRTEAAVLAWSGEVGWRPEPAIPGTSPWGHERDMERRYGPVGGPQCTRGRVTCPWPLTLSWDTARSVSRIACHEAVADSLQRVLNRVHDNTDPALIEALGLHLYGGCFSLRRKRGGTTWSTHAYGLAVDWDPARNQLRWNHEQARLAQPDALDWWRAWEDEGWTSLGRTSDFDWMHVQAPAT